MHPIRFLEGAGGVGFERVGPEAPRFELPGVVLAGLGRGAVVVGGVEQIFQEAGDEGGRAGGELVDGVGGWKRMGGEGERGERRAPVLGGNGGKKGVERDVGWVWEVSNKIWKGFGGASTRLGGGGDGG